MPSQKVLYLSFLELYKTAIADQRRAALQTVSALDRALESIAELEKDIKSGAMDPDNLDISEEAPGSK